MFNKIPCSDSIPTITFHALGTLILTLTCISPPRFQTRTRHLLSTTGTPGLHCMGITTFCGISTYVARVERVSVPMNCPTPLFEKRTITHILFSHGGCHKWTLPGDVKRATSENWKDIGLYRDAILIITQVTSQLLLSLRCLAASPRFTGELCILLDNRRKEELPPVVHF